MSRISLRALCSVGLALALFGSSACNEDECAVDGDCSSDQFCTETKVCDDRPIIVEQLCKSDAECTTDGQICNAGLCATGCRTNAGCDVGLEFCDTAELTCKAIPDECARSADCPNNFICQEEVADGPLKCLAECGTTADCEAGLTCEAGVCTGCRSNDECGAGEICRIGRCSPQDIQCDRVGEICDPALPVSNGYSCTQFPGDATSVCYESCRQESSCLPSRTIDAEGNFTDMNGFIQADYTSCPVGSLCQASSSGVEACRRSECQNPVAGQEKCDAIAAADPERFPNGASCTQTIIEEIATVSQAGLFITLLGTSEGFFCEPAGTLTRGATGCLTIPVSENPLRPAPPRQFCAPGLLCVGNYGNESLSAGKCEVPCTNNAQCDLDAGESCLGLDAQREFDTVGICGVRCEPYTVDNNACPTGTKCAVISRKDGMCSDLLEGGPGAAEVYGACVGDESCPSGTTCQGFFGASRCLPKCDPTARNQQDADRTCGDPTSNNGHIKIQHLVKDAPTVDVYVDGRRVIDDLSYGEVATNNGNWLTLKQGSHTVDVVEGSRTNNRVKLLSTTITLDPSVSELISVVPAANGGVQFGRVTGDRLAQTKTASQAVIRVAHYIVGLGAVDIVAVTDGDEAALATAAPLGESVLFGEVTGYAKIPAGTYDVYVFRQGSVRTAASALTVIEDLAVTAIQGTVFAHGRSNVVPDVLVTRFQTFTPPVLNRGYCYDLNQGTTGATSPSSGVCFERCDGYNEFGNTNSCTNSGVDTCGIFGSEVSICQATVSQVDSPYLQNCDPADAASCPYGLGCLADPFGDGDPTFGVCIWQPAGGQCGSIFSDIQGFLGCEQSSGCIGEAQPPLGQQVQPGLCTALDKNSPRKCTDFWGDRCPLGYVCGADSANCELAGRGDECGEGTENSIACAEGLFCDQGGDGVGVCRSYCTQDGYAPNPTFEGCAAEETCIPNADIAGLGECRVACSPENDGVFVDTTSCPANQQSCHSFNGNFYCTASGSIPVNTQCGAYQAFPGLRAGEVTTCAPGSLCARDITTPDSTFEVTIDSFLTIGSNESAMCRKVCRPFLANEATDCDDGYACTPILPTQEINTFSGICTPKVSQVGIGNNPDACPASDVGRMCGDASFCSLNDDQPTEGGLVCQATAECFELCNPATNLGCSPGKSCDQLGSTDAPAYFIGAFGICRDR